MGLATGRERNEPNQATILTRDKQWRQNAPSGAHVIGGKTTVDVARSVRRGLLGINPIKVAQPQAAPSADTPVAAATRSNC
jgi:hypothetical protein